jgi:hypothetical protein
MQRHAAMSAMVVPEIVVNFFEGTDFLKYLTHSKVKTHAKGTATKNSHSSIGKLNHLGFRVYVELKFQIPQCVKRMSQGI